MKIYQLVIVGIIIISLSIILSMFTPVKTLADQVKEVIVSNFPELQRVLVANTEPINVNVVNTSSGVGTKVITLFENKCNVQYNDVSPTIDTDGYSRLVIHAIGNNCFRYYADVSIDGIGWDLRQNIDWYIPDVSPRTFDIIAPKYRIRFIQNCPSECITIKGYLMK